MGVGNEPTAAYAKVNLCLFVGPTRSDGRHELVTLFESAGLADELVVTVLEAGEDQVHCPGVSGPNLVSEALAALRRAGWAPPPLRVQITKHIPVSAGLGGGSADAAAILRHAQRLAPVAWTDVEAIAAALGADVPSQLLPGPSIGTGAGEVVALVPGLADHQLVIVPQEFGLSTAEVYREADQLGLRRTADELAVLRTDLERAVLAQDQAPAVLPSRLVANDLEPAAISLRPEIAVALERVRAVGAEQALVCGSGPTVIGVFWESDFHRANLAAEGLRGSYPGATAASVVGRGAADAATNP
jgi:4-diphosphocytidyl-2-C-methyl-D-erythritol kinase